MYLRGPCEVASELRHLSRTRCVSAAFVLLALGVIVQAAATPTVTAEVLFVACIDNDGDGYAVCDGTCDESGLICGDCDDSNAAVHPGALEMCNGFDDNCDGYVDTYDKCSVGVGACLRTGPATCQPGQLFPACNIAPGPSSDEVCDGVDNNCDGRVDEDLVQPCSSGCDTGWSKCVSGVWSECTARPCCDCSVGPVEPYTTLCSALAAGCRALCVEPGIYSFEPGCYPTGATLVSTHGSDVTTIVGEVVEPRRVHGFTIQGEIWFSRCGHAVENHLIGSILSYDDCSALQVIAFNEIDGGVALGTFDLIWGNVVHGGTLWGGGHYTRVIAENVVTGSDVGIYLRGSGQIESNAVTDCATGILAVDSNYGSVNGPIVGNEVTGGDVAIRISTGFGARNLLVLDNRLAEFNQAGIWFSGPVDRLLIADNLIDSGENARATGPNGVRLEDLQGGPVDIMGNTIVGGSAGVLVSDYEGTAYPTFVTIASNIISSSHGPGVLHGVGGYLVAMNNDVHGNSPNWSGIADPTGSNWNISQDPIFVDPASHSWNLSAWSPCIDTGLSSNLPWDLNGHPRVTDGNGDGVAVQDMGAFELPADADPECGSAVAVVSNLWPPNHQLTPVTITGVSDRDRDPVMIEATGVTQDEPVGGDSGDSSPDARIVDGGAQVRAKRSGTGNGRVYRISFRADDGRGGHCDGTVMVCVPHDLGGDSSCVDDGQVYNSLGGIAARKHS